MTTEKSVAGAPGFEPGDGGIKISSAASYINARFEKLPESAPSNINSLDANSKRPASDIPTEPKAFQRWLDEKAPTWPARLRDLGYMAALSMFVRDQKAWGQSFALRKAAKADWSAFTTAYADHQHGVA